MKWVIKHHYLDILSIAIIFVIIVKNTSTMKYNFFCPMSSKKYRWKIRVS